MDGGVPTYVIALVTMVVSLGITVAGSFVIRGNRVHGGLLFSAPLLPLAIGSISAALGIQEVTPHVSPAINPAHIAYDITIRRVAPAIGAFYT